MEEHSVQRYSKLHNEGWFLSRYLSKKYTLESKYGIITNAKFIYVPDSHDLDDFMLKLNIRLEDGTGCGWDLFNIEDIKEFMSLTNSNTQEDLEDKCIMVFLEGNSPAGIKINSNLLPDNKED